jgi:hypothetical protein
MNKHTPGPWEFDKTSDNWPGDTGNEDILGSIIDRDGGWHICRIWEDVSENIEESKANAQLIAAAPDMLAMLEGLEWNEYHIGWKCHCCPVCMSTKDEEQHTDGCKLGNLLKRIKGD